MITTAMLEQIYAHCEREAPVEAAGVIVGREGRCERVIELRNDLEAVDRWAVSSSDRLALDDELTARGEDIVIVYHSHTLGVTPWPSGYDLQITAGTGWLALIVPVDRKGRHGRARLWDGPNEIPLTTR